MVDAEILESAIAAVRASVDALRATGTLAVQPTFFEVTTAVAFEIFRRAGVEIAVIEVGLGGRLDATNVVASEVTAITSIALDHERYLGRTLREIAIEKAGIIKPGIPVVVGELEEQAEGAVADVARDRGALLVHAWEGVTATRVKADAADARDRLRLRTPARDYGEMDIALAGAHQAANAVVAVRLLEQLGVAEPAIRAGLADAIWPGRLETRRFPDGREMLLDAAHNPAGATALASYLSEMRERRPLVFSVMRDKDVDGILQALAPAVSAIVLTRASNPRAAEPAALAARAHMIAPALPVSVELAPAAAIAAAWRLSPRIVVAGSIFLLGDVMRQTAG
jgi:dihydrofolate synthase/folylpolyglutamate synthase